MSKSLEKSVGRALLLTARLHRARVGERLNTLGLFPGQEQTLKLLQDSPMTMGELALALKVRPPTVSKTIGRLSLQGLVTREGSETDGRQIRVKLTEAGEKHAIEIDSIWNHVEHDMLEKLDAKEARTLRKLLRKAAKGLGKALGKESPELLEDIEPEDVES
jgi:MarR family transcriptional regulator, transcriptional regulator for hemolysin